MDEHDALKHADIMNDGSVLLGEDTVCDGSNYGRRIAVFTHLHSDHAGMFGNAKHDCERIYATLPTLEMLRAIEGSNSSMDAEEYFAHMGVTPLDYGKTIRLDGPNTRGSAGSVTLYEAHHVLGSCQVLVESPDGTRTAYTGDFGADAKPIRCNVLVMDSAHGYSGFDAKANRPSLERTLVEGVKAELEKSKNILINA